MTTLTIQAMDTASAMDKIAEQLGEDALILSTTKKDGKVFMQASNGADLPSLVQHPKDFSTMFNAGVSRSFPGKSRIEEDLEKKPKSYSPSSATLRPQAGIGPTGHDASAARNYGNRMDHINENYSGMMLTGPNGVNAELQDSTLVQLMRAGYSQNTILRLHPSFAGLRYDIGVTSFLEHLAADLANVKSEALLQKRVIFVVGPTGSGRTTLASKLAASLKDAHPGKRSCLASLSATLNETDTKLRSYARLLNIPVTQMTQDMPEQYFDKMTDFDMIVIDVTLPSEDAVEQVRKLKQHLGDQEQPWFYLSGGSSAKMIALTVEQFVSFTPTIGLTKLDECETSSAEFSALAESGIQISLLSGTKSVVGAIAFASPKILAQYLKENFQTDTSNSIFFSRPVMKKWSCNK